MKNDTGRRLLEVRKFLRMSQQQLARAVGVTPGAIAHYEKGRAAIPPERLQEIAAVFKCDPAELLQPGSPMPRFRRHGSTVTSGSDPPLLCSTSGE